MPAPSTPPGTERVIPGQVLADRYRVVELVGRGGMGEVYRAVDLKLGQPVALKFLPQELSEDPARLKALFEEVRAAFQARFVTDFGIGVVGGCCGTTPEHVAAMAEAMKNLRPQERPKDYQPQLASLFHATPLDQDSGPLIVGERTNANGSRKFKELMVAGDTEGMLQMAKEQVHEGSHVLTRGCSKAQVCDLVTKFVERNAGGVRLAVVPEPTAELTSDPS